jgi:hypothetical protein
MAMNTIDEGLDGMVLTITSAVEGELTDVQAQQLQFAADNVVRMVWNLRGVSDIAKLEAVLTRQLGPAAAAPWMQLLDPALRTLDQ